VNFFSSINQLPKSDFQDTDLQNWDLQDTDLQNWDFQDTNFDGLDSDLIDPNTGSNGPKEIKETAGTGVNQGSNLAPIIKNPATGITYYLDPSVNRYYYQDPETKQMVYYSA
jgi:hypothetical protein